MSTKFLKNQSITKENDSNEKLDKMMGKKEQKEKDCKKSDKSISFSSNKTIDGITSRIEGTDLSEYYEIKEWLKAGGSGYVFRAKFKKIQTQNFAVLKFILFDNKKEKRYKTENKKEADRRSFRNNNSS